MKNYFEWFTAMKKNKISLRLAYNCVSQCRYSEISTQSNRSESCCTSSKINGAYNNQSKLIVSPHCQREKNSFVSRTIERTEWKINIKCKIMSLILAIRLRNALELKHSFYIVNWNSQRIYSIKIDQTKFFTVINEWAKLLLNLMHSSHLFESLLKQSIFSCHWLIWRYNHGNIKIW